MIIKGLDAIRSWHYSEYDRNLQEWFAHHNVRYVRGTRADVKSRMISREADKRRIRELEQQIQTMKDEANQAYASHQMHLAMGCEDRDCRVC